MGSFHILLTQHLVYLMTPLLGIAIDHPNLQTLKKESIKIAYEARINWNTLLNRQLPELSTNTSQFATKHTEDGEHFQNLLDLRFSLRCL